MDFIDQLKQYSERVQQLKDHLLTEEATKNALVMPFFQLLGYDVFNPLEFKPECIADFGIKKGEKVDYAICLNNKICMLVESKGVNDSLATHSGQLFRYFSTTKARFGILTNGIVYKFFTDLEESNKMDTKPFLEFDLLNIKESLVPELKKFSKASFDEAVIFNTASELKYSYEIKKYFEQQLKEPSDEFTVLLAKSFLDIKMTRQVVEKFKPIVKKTINNYISELMNDKITTALKGEKSNPDPEPQPIVDVTPVDEGKQIITTEDEIASLFTIKGILAEATSPKRIVGDDHHNYYSINLDGKANKWICRLRLTDKKKSIAFNQDGKEDRVVLNEIEDLYDYKQRLIDTVILLNK